MPARSSPDELAQQARFIFEGTVEHLQATTMANLPATGRTVVVRVDKVVQAPPSLNGAAGQSITVQLASRERVKEGQHWLFFTNGWLFGETVAVQSIGHRRITDVPASLAGVAAAPADETTSRDLQARLSDAHTVVTGRVTSVRVPPEPAGPPVAAAGAQEPTRRYSEHDPVWRDAVVQVESVEKGGQVPSNVVIRFASSDDVRWHQVPKLEPGQEGVFLLQQPAGGAAAGPMAVAAAGGEPVFTISHALDVRPSDQLAHIKQLIGTAPEP
jgi:hypothetical protein